MRTEKIYRFPPFEPWVICNGVPFNTNWNARGHVRKRTLFRVIRLLEPERIGVIREIGLKY